MRRRFSAGTTLVELLTVLGIVSILLSLALPAVQAARAAARRVACSNRVKQLALGIHLYEQTNLRLPAGTALSDGQFPYRGWHSEILPFIELNTLHSEILQDYSSFQNPFSPLHHRHLKTSVSLFECPDDPRSGAMALSHNHHLFVGLTSFLGIHGTVHDRSDGVFFYGSATRFAELQKGQSNTLLFGERPPSPGSDLGWWYAGIGVGNGLLEHTLYTEVNPPSLYSDCVIREARFVMGKLDNECDVDHFWSLHPGGAHFSRADGSVAFFAYGSDSTIRSLSSR